nr:hypothetical protein CFOL_v3_29112 [Ipomoea batatas]
MLSELFKIVDIPSGDPWPGTILSGAGGARSKARSRVVYWRSLFGLNSGDVVLTLNCGIESPRRGIGSGEAEKGTDEENFGKATPPTSATPKNSLPTYFSSSIRRTQRVSRQGSFPSGGKLEQLKHSLISRTRRLSRDSVIQEGNWIPLYPSIVKLCSFGGGFRASITSTLTSLSQKKLKRNSLRCLKFINLSILSGSLERRLHPSTSKVCKLYKEQIASDFRPLKRLGVSSFGERYSAKKLRSFPMSQTEAGFTGLPDFCHDRWRRFSILTLSSCWSILWHSFLITLCHPNSDELIYLYIIILGKDGTAPHGLNSKWKSFALLSNFLANISQFLTILFPSPRKRNPAKQQPSIRVGYLIQPMHIHSSHHSCNPIAPRGQQDSTPGESNLERVLKWLPLCRLLCPHIIQHNQEPFVGQTGLDSFQQHLQLRQIRGAFSH